MNQFRRAKQKALDSGHQVENITDLQTAGVKAPAKEETNTKEQKTETLTPPVPTPIKLETPVSTEDTPIKTETPIITKPVPVKVETPVITEPVPVKVETPVITEPVPVKVETPVITEPVPVKVETPVITEPVPVKVETPVITEPVPVKAETPVVSSSVTVRNGAPTISEPIPSQTETPITIIPTPVYEEAILEPTYEMPQPQETPIPVPVRIALTPNIQEVATTVPQTIASMQTNAKTSTTKKNIPNIFAPKNEAKSMRKSLVLKPTSVKIAENYCAKNGGSFNELIQTLLDNFIDEYGL